MRLIITSFLVSLLLTGLPKTGNEYSGVQFQKEVEFGTNNEIIVGDVTALSVDAKGQVFIADGTQTTIHIFSPDGTYIKSMGRVGKGPGEFSAITFNTSIEIHQDKLFITDTQTFFPHRAHVFSLQDFSFDYTLKLLAENRGDYEELKGHYPKRVIPQKDGTFLVSYHKTPHQYKDSTSYIKYYVQDISGKIVSGPIFKQKDRTNLTYLVRDEYPYIAIHSFPFFGKTILDISEDEYLYALKSKEFKIDIYDSNGGYLRSIEHKFENRIFSKSKVLDRYKETDYGYNLGDGVALKMIEQADNLPESWPAIDHMFIDDENRIWVSTIVDNDEVYEWWILENSGELINKFEWPRNKPIQTVRNNKLYTIEENPKTFEKEVVQYQILMNE
jgi:hypothetical protein